MQIDDYFLKVWNATEILFYTQFGENSLRNTKLFVDEMIGESFMPHKSLHI